MSQFYFQNFYLSQQILLNVHQMHTCSSSNVQ